MRVNHVVVHSSRVNTQSSNSSKLESFVDCRSGERHRLRRNLSALTDDKMLMRHNTHMSSPTNQRMKTACQYMRAVKRPRLSEPQAGPEVSTLPRSLTRKMASPLRVQLREMPTSALASMPLKLKRVLPADVRAILQREQCGDAACASDIMNWHGRKHETETGYNHSSVNIDDGVDDDDDDVEDVEDARAWRLDLLRRARAEALERDANARYLENSANERATHKIFRTTSHANALLHDLALRGVITASRDELEALVSDASRVHWCCTNEANDSLSCTNAATRNLNVPNVRELFGAAPRTVLDASTSIAHGTFTAVTASDTDTDTDVSLDPEPASLATRRFQRRYRRGLLRAADSVSHTQRVDTPKCPNSVVMTGNQASMSDASRGNVVGNLFSSLPSGSANVGTSTSRCVYDQVVDCSAGVVRYFAGHGWYKGYVHSWRMIQQRPVFSIRYDDGDSEEILLPMLRLAMKNYALTDGAWQQSDHVLGKCTTPSSNKTRRCFCCGLEMIDPEQCEITTSIEYDKNALVKMQVKRMEVALEQMIVCERCYIADVIVGARYARNGCCGSRVEFCVRWLAIGVRSSRISSNAAYSYVHSRHHTEELLCHDQDCTWVNASRVSPALLCRSLCPPAEPQVVLDAKAKLAAAFASRTATRQQALGKCQVLPAINMHVLPAKKYTISMTFAEKRRWIGHRIYMAQPGSGRTVIFEICKYFAPPEYKRTHKHANLFKLKRLLLCRESQNDELGGSEAEPCFFDLNTAQTVARYKGQGKQYRVGWIFVQDPCAHSWLLQQSR